MCDVLSVALSAANAISFVSILLGLRMARCTIFVGVF